MTLDRYRNKALLTSLSFIVLSCSLFDRSPESGYSQARPSRSKKVSQMATKPEMVTLKTRLKSLENSLSGKKEIDQYSKALPWFRDDLEKEEFLSLANFEARQKWLNEKDFIGRSSRVQSEMHELIEAQDIALGMPQALVLKSWGEPEAVEVSGNPQFKNERWRYSQYIATVDGYKSEKKVVYFEGGKVVGWEIE